MEDPEVTALQQIGRIMVDLDTDARRRILDYLQDRWGAQQLLAVDELVEIDEPSPAFSALVDAIAAHLQGSIDAVAAGLANLTRTTQGDGR